MTFSDAIRLGAMMKPQAFGGLTAVRSIGLLGLREEVIGTCALGAAFDAAGCPNVPMADGESAGTPTRGADKPTTKTLVPPDWAHLFLSVGCPVASPCPVMAHGVMHSIVAHLNDDHRWTREQIADWVESVECAHEPQPQPDGAQIAREAGR